MRAARFVQAGFFVTGLIFLLVVFFNIGGLVGMALSLAMSMPFSGLIMFGMKCPKCGVSYYFANSKAGTNLTGVNMFKPVAEHCRKCGAIR